MELIPNTVTADNCNESFFKAFMMMHFVYFRGQDIQKPLNLIKFVANPAQRLQQRNMLQIMLITAYKYKLHY
jgi:hypothetical protein